MNTISQDVNISDYYFEFLKDLKPDNKLDLISKLSQSMKTKEPDTDTSLQSLFGAYQSDETADEMIAGLKNARVFNRNIEPL